MTREEAIHKLEYSKKAYQTLIDEKVDSGKLVGDGVRGEWKAETPLDEAYKSMIEALDMAIKALEQQPCEDAISREAVNVLVDELARAISDERCFISRGRSTANIMQDILDLPSVTPKTESKNVFDKIRAEIEEERKGYPPSADEYKTINKVLQILDKYKSESEGNA